MCVSVLLAAPCAVCALRCMLWDVKLMDVGCGLLRGAYNMKGSITLTWCANGMMRWCARWTCAALLAAAGYISMTWCDDVLTTDLFCSVGSQWAVFALCMCVLISKLRGPWCGNRVETVWSIMVRWLPDERFTDVY